MFRVVLDTNVLVASCYNRRSASLRIVDACLSGDVVAVVSPAVRVEYERIVPRAVHRRDELDRVGQWLAQSEVVHPAETPAVVAADPEDDKFVAAAIAGRADVLVTNDDHLLSLGESVGVRILRPADFEALMAARDDRET